MQTLHDRHSEEVIVEAAKSLVSRCDPRIGLIRSWDFGEWNYPVIIDNMMNLEMLFWASKHTGDPVYRDVAVRHADITMQNHFRDDASSFHVVSYNDDGTIESRGTFRVIPTPRRGPADRRGASTATRCATARRATRNT